MIYFFLFIKIPIHPHNRPLTRDVIRMVWTQNSCNHNKMLLCKSVKHELNLRRLFKASWVLFDQNLSEPKKIEITVADILRSSLKCCTVAWLCSQTWHSVMAKPIKKYFTEDTEQVNHTSYRITNKIRVREILQGYVQHLYRELKKTAMNETVFLSSCYFASGFNFFARTSLEKCDTKKKLCLFCRILADGHSVLSCPLAKVRQRQI